MVAVGLFAAQIGGRALWLLPSTFLGAMMVGSMLGHLQAPLPGVEMGILVSDFLLGGLILFGARLKAPALVLPLVGLFAIFHGYAHGAEMPTSAIGLAYGGGFVIATALLHAIGVGIGYAIDKLANNREQLLKVGGATVLLGSIYVALS
jgi:urease accessory protein